MPVSLVKKASRFTFETQRHAARFVSSPLGGTRPCMLFWGRAIFCLMLSVVVLGSSSRTGIARISSPFHAVASAFIGAPGGIPCFRSPLRSFRSAGAVTCAPRPPEQARVGGNPQRKVSTISPEKKARLAEENRLQIMANEMQLNLYCPPPSPARAPRSAFVSNPGTFLPFVHRCDFLVCLFGSRWSPPSVVKLRVSNAVGIHWGARSHAHAASSKSRTRRQRGCIPGSQPLTSDPFAGECMGFWLWTSRRTGRRSTLSPR